MWTMMKNKTEDCIINLCVRCIFLKIKCLLYRIYVIASIIADVISPERKFQKRPFLCLHNHLKVFSNNPRNSLEIRLNCCSQTQFPRVLVCVFFSVHFLLSQSFFSSIQYSCDALVEQQLESNSLNKAFAKSATLCNFYTHDA